MTTRGAPQDTGEAATYASEDLTTPGSARGRGSGIGLMVGIVLIAIAVWIVLAALDDSEGRELGVTLEQVADEPGELEGRSVTVSGELAEYVIPGRAFPLGEGYTGPVLVVPANGTRVPPLGEDDVAQVTGTVHPRFESGELAEETDVDVEADAFDLFDGRPVIVATSIARIPTDQDND